MHSPGGGKAHGYDAHPHALDPDPTADVRRVIAHVGWNIAVLANEVKRIADVMEDATKKGGALNHG